MTAPAILAAHQASDATAELLRYAVEGPANERAFGDLEVVGLLAEACRGAIAIERAHYCDDDTLGDLEAAISTFLEGWVL